jgi:hypothetical protein
LTSTPVDRPAGRPPCFKAARDIEAGASLVYENDDGLLPFLKRPIRDDFGPLELSLQQCSLLLGAGLERMQKAVL